MDDVGDAILLAAVHERAIGEKFLISGPEPVTWLEFYGAYEKIVGREAVVGLSEREIVSERRERQKTQRLSHGIRRGLARRPQLRERLLAIPPQGWLMMLGSKILPMAVQKTIVNRYNAFWQMPGQSSETLDVPDVNSYALYAAKMRVSIDKARQILGYEPAFDLQRGMELTSRWVRWANLLAV